MRRAPWAGVLVFAMFFAWTASMVIPSVMRSRDRSGNDAQVVASRALGKAIVEAPFTVRLPTELPGGALVVRAFLDEPDYDRGVQVYTLNTYYAVPGSRESGGGRYVHIWQTNDPFLARNPGGDPTTRGEPEIIDGREWARVVDNRLRDRPAVTAFSARLDDGVTVAIDATVPDDARATIRALGAVRRNVPVGGVDVDVFLAAQR